MPLEVRSAITGHSAKVDESAGYGDGTKTLTGVLSEWMAKVSMPAAIEAGHETKPLDSLQVVLNAETAPL